jgi:SWI/SNF-related matrix-associated actin-dependent regulator 1 of chromatin subfamily A
MRQIIQQGSDYIVAFDYSPAIISDIKLIPGRRFDSTSKNWVIPAVSKRHLEQLAMKHGFSFQGSETPSIFKNFVYDIPEMPTLAADIPLKRELFPFQKQGVQYILDKKRVIVGDQPGLGKTAQAIAALIAADTFPALIICPSSLKENWRREVEMWTSKTAMVLNDNIKGTWNYFFEAKLADIFIVNFESLKKYFVAEINQPIGADGKKVPLRINHVKFSAKINLFKAVVVDESHRVKDFKTQQAKFTKGVCSGKEYIFLLTGTPVVNKPRDLVSQLGILDRLGDMGGYKNFEKWFCEADNRWRELNVLLRRNCFYRREKSDVLKDLPAKMRQAVICDITTRREYNDALTDLADYLKRYKQATDEQIQRSMRGEIMVRIGALKNISARGKIADVVDYVSNVVDAGEKIILFTHLREVQQQLKSFFPGAVTILGDDDMATRQRNVDAFQNDPRVQVIICSIKAAGVGLTLTASSRVAFVELPWHPADCEQCEDRAHRIGQTDSVQCTYFLGKDTIDEDIYKIIADKRDMSRQITGAREEVEENVINGVINILMKGV